MNKVAIFSVSALLLSLPPASRAQQPASAVRDSQPTYRVTMVPRTILAINYENRTKTEVGFQGSPLMPLAKGQADVEGKNGRIGVNAEFKNLEQPQKFGPEYLTYVLWAVTPEGRANNLGELLLTGDKSKLQATATLQTFGLVVTAEPYYAVVQPSDAVVLENVVTPATSGTLQKVNVSYNLFNRGLYSYNFAAASQAYGKSKVPLELEEARNAVQIAKNSGAQQYSPESLSKAEQSLSSAEAMVKRGNTKVIVQNSRDAVQNSAEALDTTIKRRQEEAQAKERAAAAQQTADARAAALASAARQEQETTARQQAELEKEKAELQAQKAAQENAQAQLQAQQDAQARAAAEARSQQDAQAASQAQQAAAQAQQAAAQSELEKQQLRAALLQQFNRILPTTDTPDR